ncbi:hypothetical protein MNBD_ALPHA03-161 [hydrothermal vent metagenome]|uniref:DUF2948 family protein n=1 Tax=hydrothermal vent metagenome TaxID=652676 RepID=A0A3B1ASV5_9ZZZZ
MAFKLKEGQRLEKLKLRAEDRADITILSAYLQDAVTIIGDITYQHKGRRFVMMLNRYVWENRCPETGDVILREGQDMEQNINMACCRIRTGLHFDDVLKINSQNITITAKDKPLELLSIEAYKTEKKTFHVDFIFSGDGIIRLECEIISAHMQDIGTPWPAKCHPEHDILDDLQDESS